MAISIPIILTFDDGPMPERTGYVLSTLSSHYADPIVGAFFVQTHSRGPKGTGGYSRMNTKEGDEIVARAHNIGNHIIAIHTGSSVDHQSHAIRVSASSHSGGGGNGLESDLLRAKAHITKIAGVTPRYVRAPYFDLGASRKVKPQVLQSYHNTHLRHVGANVQPKDGEDAARVLNAIAIKSLGKMTEVQKADLVRRTICLNLRDMTNNALRRGDNHLVVLFHDIQYESFKYKLLGDYLDVIRDTVANFPPAGILSPAFAKTRAEAEAILAISKVEY